MNVPPDPPRVFDPFENDLEFSEAADENNIYGDQKDLSSDVRIPSQLAACETHVRDLSGSLSLREQFGLSNDFNRSAATVVKFGIKVTPKEAEFLAFNDFISSQFDLLKIQEVIKNNEGIDLVGLRWTNRDTRLEIYVKSEMVEKVEALEEYILASTSAIETDHLLIRHVDSGLPVDELLEIKKSIFLDYQKIRKEVVDVSLTVDETCGKILVVTTTDEARIEFEQVIKGLNVDPSIVGVVVDPNSGFKPVSVNHAHNPHRGGLTLHFKKPGSANLCTSAVPWWNQNRTRRMLVTAAHCLPGAIEGKHSIQINWYQNHPLWYADNKVNAWSTTTYGYGGGSPWDVATTKMANSMGYNTNHIINPAGNHTAVTMGWWKWDPLSTVNGHTVCHSGRMQNTQKCGVVTNSIWSGSYNGKSFFGLVKASMTAIGTDSGGTVWTVQSGSWYTGVMAATSSSSSLFSHTGFIDNLSTNLDAPVNMY